MDMEGTNMKPLYKVVFTQEKTEPLLKMHAGEKAVIIK